MRVGIVGATGQVGGVMRRRAGRAELPGRRASALRLGALGRPHPPRGTATRSSSRTPPPPTSPGSTSRCSRPARPRRASSAPRSPPPARSSSTTRRRGAWTPTCRSWCPRSTRTTLDRRPQGHRRQPQLHDDGGHAGAQAAAREAGLRPADRQHLPGGVGRRAGRRRPSSTSRSARWSTGAAELTFDGARGRVPARRTSSPSRSRSTCCRSPARSSTTAADETDEEQKLRNETRKILGIPDLPVSRHLRAGAGVHRPLAVDQRRVRPADLAGAGPRAARRRAGRRARRRARRRSRRPGDDPTFVGRIRRRPHGRPRPGAVRLATTTCARAPRSTRSRSPNCCCTEMCRVKTRGTVRA